jgi:hypothetical protein
MQRCSLPELSRWERTSPAAMPTPCLRSSKGTRDWWPCSSPVAGTDVETVVRTARKITHYGRYGRLSFKDGVNTGKGVGEASGSPLVVDLEKGS